MFLKLQVLFLLMQGYIYRVSNIFCEFEVPTAVFLIVKLRKRHRFITDKPWFKKLPVKKESWFKIHNLFQQPKLLDLKRFDFRKKHSAIWGKIPSFWQFLRLMSTMIIKSLRPLHCFSCLFCKMFYWLFFKRFQE